MRNILCLLLLIPVLAGASDEKPPVGSFGFDWLKPAVGCRKLAEADIKRFRTCQPGGEAGGFGVPGIKSTHTCQISKRSEWMIYATGKDCRVAFETMQANAP